MSNVEQAFFYGQIAHESGNFKYNSENLNYSKRGLLGIFPKYFDDDSAEKYEREPEKIASRVYANRMGNGNEKSGDGWKYRGGGLIQITGKDNYTKLAEYVGVPFDEITEYVRTPEGSIKSALWFWNKNNLSKDAYEFNIKRITRRINGGYHGLQDRADKTIAALLILDGVLNTKTDVCDTVKFFQSALNYRYSYNLLVDGDFGKNTEAACERLFGSRFISTREYRMLFGL